MAHENKVIESLEDPAGTHCVDLLDLRDGAFGYQLCRRDPEDGHGWRVISDGNGARFDCLDAARRAARIGLGCRSIRGCIS